MVAGHWSKRNIAIGNLLVRSVDSVNHPLKVNIYGDCMLATHHKEYGHAQFYTLHMYVISSKPHLPQTHPLSRVRFDHLKVID